MKRSFATRLTLAFALLLLAYGAIVALLGRYLEAEYEAEASQRLAYGLAQHIVGHWPEATSGTQAGDGAARTALLNMLMVVNPGVEVYMLDADGRVDSYIGEPGMVRRHQVDLDAGARLPRRCRAAAARHRPEEPSAATRSSARPCSRRAPAIRARRATCTWCSKARHASRWPARWACAAPGRRPAWRRRWHCWRRWRWARSPSAA